MVTTERTRETILREMQTIRVQVGRMTVKSPGYATAHAELNELLTELEALSG